MTSPRRPIKNLLLRYQGCIEDGSELGNHLLLWRRSTRFARPKKVKAIILAKFASKHSVADQATVDEERKDGAGKHGTDDKTLHDKEPEKKKKKRGKGRGKGKKVSGTCKFV